MGYLSLASSVWRKPITMLSPVMSWHSQSDQLQPIGTPSNTG